MPETGVPRLVPPRPGSHTSTTEWKSFELRMRQRRAERCRLRAHAALDEGLIDEARAAFEEAQRLDPDSPDLLAIERRLVAPPEDVAPEPDAPVTAGAPLERERTSRPRMAEVLAMAAAAAIAAGAWAGWLVSRNATARPPASVSEQVTSDARASSATPSPDRSPGVQVHRLEAPIVAQTPPLSPLREPFEPNSTAAPPPDASRSPADASRLPASSDVPRSAQPSGSEASAPGSSTTQAPATVTAPPATPERSLAAVGAAGTTAGVPDGTAGTTPAPTSNPMPLPNTTATGATSPPLESLPPAPRAAAIEPLRDVAVPAAGVADTAVPPAVPPRREPVVDESARVRAVLNGYAAAYTNLDARAAQAVWPAVDARALARAFDGLSSQSVSLGTCDVRVAGPTAHASCAGRASWTPKVGGGSQAAARRWEFDLSAADGAWQIVRVTAR